MTTYERRQELIEVLVLRGKDKIDNLAFEFGVSSKTIARDIDFLSLYYPLYSVKGGYYGGIYIDSRYRVKRKFLNAAEIQLFQELACELCGEKLRIMQNFLKTFTFKEVEE